MIISIASGKGGTGKTLVATSLAISPQVDNKVVQLLDCDVEEPNAHLLLNPEISSIQHILLPVPEINDTRCNRCGICSDVCSYHAIAVFPNSVLVFPELCHSCGACSYLCPEKAITEVGRDIGVIEKGSSKNVLFAHGKLNIGETRAVPLIHEVKKLIKAANTVIIDVSPGTSCPVVESITGSDYCILVTEPTPFGFNDLKLAVELTGELRIPTGIVINRTGIGDNQVEDFCNKANIPILLKIPFDIRIAQMYSRGVTLATGLPEWKARFIEVYQKIESILNNKVKTG